MGHVPQHHPATHLQSQGTLVGGAGRDFLSGAAAAGAVCQGHLGVGQSPRA